MLRLVQLITAAAAAGTTAPVETPAEAIANKDAPLARQNMKLEYNVNVKKMITGSTKISGSSFDMPNDRDDKIPSYSDVIANQPNYCYQCVFGGGNWSPATKAVTATCEFPQLQTVNTKDLVAVSEDVTYEALFDGLAVCAFQDADKTRVQKEQVWTNKMCQSTFDLDKFSAGSPTGKKDDKPYSWSYIWGAAPSVANEGKWCYFRTYLPESLAGGLFMTHMNNADTKVAVKTKSSKMVDRYFDNTTLKTTAWQSTGQISLMNTEYVSIYIAQNTVYDSTLGTKNDFHVTFTRATYIELGHILIKKDNGIVWVLAGVMVLVLSLCMASFKYMTRNEGKFSQEDCYVKV